MTGSVITNSVPLFKVELTAIANPNPVPLFTLLLIVQMLQIAIALPRKCHNVQQIDTSLILR
ncbi:MAG: hypothetical protein V7K98_05940 [Nostoc sp.]|uniref:hypothetical protein n=1 Tax=Nostoc sp. TaxID=1180 RepID=UPI002FF8CB71